MWKLELFERENGKPGRRVNATCPRWPRESKAGHRRRAWPMAESGRRGFIADDRAWLIEHLKQVSGSAWKVRTALKIDADPVGYCFPSIETLSERSGLAVSTVQLGIRELAAIGWIKVHIRARKGSVVQHGYTLIAGMKSTPVDSVDRAEIQTGTGPKFRPVPSRNSSEHRAEIRPLSKDIEVKPRSKASRSGESDRRTHSFRDAIFAYFHPHECWTRSGHPGTDPKRSNCSRHWLRIPL